MPCTNRHELGVRLCRFMQVLSKLRQVNDQESAHRRSILEDRQLLAGGPVAETQSQPSTI